MLTDAEVLQKKKYLINEIRDLNLPVGHPFLEPEFEKDFILLTMLNLRILFKQDVVSYFFPKLLGNSSGKFNRPVYLQGLNEYNVFYYLIMGLINSKFSSSVHQVKIEPNALVNGKKLEYSFRLTSPEVEIAVEVKTIDADPFERENIEFKSDDKIIKPYFPEVDLLQYYSSEELSQYKILEKSSHSRQFGANIIKINEKFLKNPKILNIGFLVFQFATSQEEAFSYLLHPEKGYYYKNKAAFSNIDCLVIFSMTPFYSLDLIEPYDEDHVLSMLFRNDPTFLEIITALRLEKAFFQDGKIPFSEISILASKDHGKFRLVNKNGILFFSSEENSEEVENDYSKRISKKINTEPK